MLLRLGGQKMLLRVCHADPSQHYWLHPTRRNILSVFATTDPSQHSGFSRERRATRRNIRRGARPVPTFFGMWPKGRHVETFFMLRRRLVADPSQHFLLPFRRRRKRRHVETFFKNASRGNILRNGVPVETFLHFRIVDTSKHIECFYVLDVETFCLRATCTSKHYST